MQRVLDERQTAKVAWWHWHRHLYNWVIHFAGTRHGVTALFILSFAESSFFPVPPDVLLGPLTLGAPRKWLRFAVSCSIASVLGGILGYCIGMFLWEGIGQWVFAHFAWAKITPENFATFQHWYEKYDFSIVFLCGFTPLPYKVCTISAGIAHISFPWFLVASTVSRSARFFMVAGLFGWKGEAIRPIIEKYFNWFSLAFAVLLIGGFAILKWVN
jgi:membrane protein YqaA with SNARE-associated domain